ncbi:heavy metal-binding domain-containing protein [Hydrobacter penzbergensis]|nr:heavy metal-binding domain-containing protein [Hydrobacter penzbergensis]
MKREVTKTYTCPMHTEVVSDHEGVCPKCKAQLVVDRRGSKQAIKEYTCTMHPDEYSSKPGKCPICNKPLVKVKS